LLDVRNKGYTFAPQALTRSFLIELSQELAAHAFQPFTQTKNGVRQEFDVYTPKAWPPLLQELGIRLGQLVRHHRGSIAALASWQPNHLAVQRYNSPTSGIGRHRDYARDILLVASFTVSGSGKVILYPSAPKPRVVVLETGPGSLLLLRGPGLTDEDGRVAHAVCPPIVCPRISATYRLDSSQNQPGQG
jgi:hypothetical protein